MLKTFHLVQRLLIEAEQYNHKYLEKYYKQTTKNSKDIISTMSDFGKTGKGAIRRNSVRYLNRFKDKHEQVKASKTDTSRIHENINGAVNGEEFERDSKRNILKPTCIPYIL